MATIPIPDPASLPPVPWLALPRAWLRLVFYRYIPWPMVTQWRALTYRLKFAVRRNRKERAARAAIKGLVPDVSPENLRRLTLRNQLVTRLGRNTFAPVFAKSRTDLIQMLKPVGLKTLDDFKEKAQGVIIVGAHAGFNGWTGPALLGMGYPVHLTQRHHASPGKLLMYRMADWGKMILPFPEPGQEGFHLKKLHDMLCQGEWLEHTGDSPDSRKTAIKGKFLGHKVRFVHAPWTLARLSGAPAVPVFILADAAMQPQMFVGPAIYVNSDTPARQALTEAFQIYLNFLEELLRDRPWNLDSEQWETMIKMEAGL